MSEPNGSDTVPESRPGAPANSYRSCTGVAPESIGLRISYSFLVSYLVSYVLCFRSHSPLFPTFPFCSLRFPFVPYVSTRTPLGPLHMTSFYVSLLHLVIPSLRNLVDMSPYPPSCFSYFLMSTCYAFRLAVSIPRLCPSCSAPEFPPELRVFRYL